MSDTIKFRALASGSSGNSLFIRIGDTRLLIDAGISCRRINRGLAEMGESIGELDAILVTHEHSDHVKGLRVLLSKHPQTAIYATRGTISGCDERFDTPDGWRPISADTAFRIGQVQIEPFELFHDANEPTGFRLDAPGFSMGLATDLGYWTDELAERLLGCHLLVIEANYDAQMLRNGPYPAFLKRRIASSQGHLSNDQARALVAQVAGPDLTWLVLAHLSQKNNAAQLAVDAVSRGALEEMDVNIIAAEKTAGAVIEFDQAETSAPRPTSQGVLF